MNRVRGVNRKQGLLEEFVFICLGWPVAIITFL